MASPRLVLDLPDWVVDLAPPGTVLAGDEGRMELVVRLAAANVQRGSGGPFGAAVFETDSGQLVAAGVNSVMRLRNGVMHAEIVAIMLAQHAVGSHTLRASGGRQHELVTSCEPCAMCLGAIVTSGVRRLVIGAAREDAQGIGFEEGPVFPQSYAYLAARGIAVVRGIKRSEAQSVLADYRRAGGPVYQPVLGEEGRPAV
jgi:tRNA(Arg) A34 adenosine deaminase TadA